MVRVFYIMGVPDIGFAFIAVSIFVFHAQVSAAFRKHILYVNKVSLNIVSACKGLPDAAKNRVSRAFYFSEFFCVCNFSSEKRFFCRQNHAVPVSQEIRFGNFFPLIIFYHVDIPFIINILNQNIVILAYMRYNRWFSLAFSCMHKTFKLKEGRGICAICSVFV